MRLHDIHEAVEDASFVAGISRIVADTVRRFVEEQVKSWTRDAIAHRRASLGYHPYRDEHEGRRRFDQETFDRETAGWNPEVDWIGDRLDELLPDPEKSAHNPVYALLGRVSDAITNATRAHVRSRFGDPVPLDRGRIQRRVDHIRVSLWWRTRSGEKEYLGKYRPSSYHANTGEETLIEIIVDRRDWWRKLRDETGAFISGEGGEFDWFASEIINTFMHEYTHLVQDIKGRTGALGLIPGKKGRYFSNYEDDPYHQYLGKVAEIDAHASAAAAEVVARVAQGFARYGARWNKDWTVDRVDDDEWNARIDDAIAGTAYGEIPRDEYRKYIEGLDRRYARIDPGIDDKFLSKVRQRFVRSYVNRLMKYRRRTTLSPGKAGPKGQLP